MHGYNLEKSAIRHSQSQRTKGKGGKKDERDKEKGKKEGKKRGGRRGRGKKEEKDGWKDRVILLKHKSDHA